jgi:DTW domain-containing protein YfiP
MVKRLKLALMDHLQQMDAAGRLACSLCGKSCSLYCCSCVKMLVAMEELPQVCLPLHVELIKHVSELDSKSTALHAKLLAQDHVTLYSYPHQFPEHVLEDAIMLFPNSRSISMDKVNWSKMRRVVVLDGTWSQVKGMNLHPVLQKLPCIRLEEVETLFWRSNGRRKEERPDFLATIEAIYHFFCQYARVTTGIYDGQYDNLLLLFVYNYLKIRQIMSCKIRESDR